MTEGKGYRTYVSARPFGEMAIPVPIQHIYLRTYAERKGLLYKLAVNEFIFDNCYLQLEHAVGELEEDRHDGILMSSIHMLPESKSHRLDIYDRVIRTGSKMFFALEDMSIGNAEDIDKVEEILTIRNTLKHCPSDFPRHLMPSRNHKTSM